MNYKDEKGEIISDEQINRLNQIGITFITTERLKELEERYFTPEQICNIESMAYDDGFVAGCEDGHNTEYITYYV